MTQALYEALAALSIIVAFMIVVTMSYWRTQSKREKTPPVEHMVITTSYGVIVDTPRYSLRPRIFIPVVHGDHFYQWEERLRNEAVRNELTRDQIEAMLLVLKDRYDDWKRDGNNALVFIETSRPVRVLREQVYGLVERKS